ncbi:hypothetical protein MVES1_003367 [Malassezia vespertilionis]|uniref:uncharacterized protein n=1 Tax=Malassezia vespertilionis TaxID=2020962 RepID=UPI0024B19288|nr:uncharacterized protein MVES1_003367 [Malassezia vespertilionis]WFD07998.1 hypothetical protein MVES1_003367 [Malassezia vespertilionis]
MHMLGEDTHSNDVEVTWEDQERINKFSRLHAALADVEEEMQVRRTEREELEDLGLEIELLDDDTVLCVCVC